MYILIRRELFICWERSVTSLSWDLFSLSDRLVILHLPSCPSILTLLISQKTGRYGKLFSSTPTNCHFHPLHSPCLIASLGTLLYSHHSWSVRASSSFTKELFLVGSLDLAHISVNSLFIKFSSTIPCMPFVSHWTLIHQFKTKFEPRSSLKCIEFLCSMTKVKYTTGTWLQRL